MDAVSLAMLHFHPRLGDLDRNADRLLAGLERAAEAGARWVLTPELCLSGYLFQGVLGSDWIQPQPDRWVAPLMEAVQRLGITLFLGHAERDPGTQQCHNALLVVSKEGLAGRHRKIHVIPGAEAWATRGDRVAPLEVDGHSVGLLVCADAYTGTQAFALREAGAQLLVSAAAWSPMPHGPEGAWESRSLETGLPLFVCNRTGADTTLDFSQAESGLYWQGIKRFAHAGPEAILRLDWDPDQGLRRAETLPMPGGSGAT